MCTRTPSVPELVRRGEGPGCRSREGDGGSRERAEREAAEAANHGGGSPLAVPRLLDLEREGLRYPGTGGTPAAAMLGSSALGTRAASGTRRPGKLEQTTG
jgi:hypothetical protein